MSKEKYQALMDQMNRQKIAIDQEKVRGDRRLSGLLMLSCQEAVTELSSQLKKKTHELVETSKKLTEVRETLDCTWTVIQKRGGGDSLVRHLDEDCSLSSQAHLLLAVNDEAAVERRTERTERTETEAGGGAGPAKRHRHSHHVSNNDRQHWLLG